MFEWVLMNFKGTVIYYTWKKTHFAVGNLHTGHNQTTSCIKRTLKIITFLISNTDLVRIQRYLLDKLLRKELWIQHDSF